MSENKTSIHPLVATAAGAVILASLVGVASMTGLLPKSDEKVSEAIVEASSPNSANVVESASAMLAASVEAAPVAAIAEPAPVAVASPVPTPVPVKPKPVVASKPKPVVQVAQNEVTPEPKPLPIEKPICLACGTVESVTSREEKAEKGSGVGAVAGALLGGVIGNQVGGGNGKKLATVAGAIGGGLAGNEIEKRKNSQMVYEVKVVMENGEVRIFKPKNAPDWRSGDKVKVVDGQLTFQ